MSHSSVLTAVPLARSLRRSRPVNSAYDFDLVCIGSGPAGQRGAVQAAKLGMRAAIIEKQPFVGSVCIDTGTIPSKTLREAVVIFSGLAGKGDRLPWARVDTRPTCGGVGGDLGGAAPQGRAAPSVGQAP